VNLKRNSLLVGAILLAFIAGIAFGGGVLFGSLRSNGNTASTAALAAVNQQSVGKSSLTNVGPNTISDIVTKTTPAVVKIESTSTSQSQKPLLNVPFFREYFGGQGTAQPQTLQQTALGSGFIISKDGYILTNQHAVDGANDIQVTIVGQNNPVKAKLVGSDQSLDLAVLKVDVGNNLPYLKLGASDQMSVGDWVIAIGNPDGLDHTVTVGVIGAKERPITIEGQTYKNLLQTDASINPGNSGGPLINLSGEVIGINTAVNAQAQGIGFAIPSKTVQGVLQKLMK
jgi:serine protease Do